MRSDYRRGSVLGLTIAEVFLLLVFLVLLVTLALSSRLSEEKKSYEEEITILKREKKAAEFITPEEIETLRLAAESSEKERDHYRNDFLEMKQRLERVERLLENVSAQAAGLEQERDRYKGEWVQKKQQLKDTQERLGNIRAQAEVTKQERDHYRNDFLEMKQRLERVERLLGNISAQAAGLEQERDRYKGEWAQEKQRLENITKALDNALGRQQIAETALDMLRRKGENPPCWYEVVPNRSGEIREKPHYILNVAVFDQSFVIAPQPIPSGAAENDNGLPYAREAELLGVSNLPYGKKLSDDEFIKYLTPLFEKGKNSEVRTYSCIFFVRVWDKTSFEAKTRWKQAHDRVLESMFGTYEVQNDTWPMKKTLE